MSWRVLSWNLTNCTSPTSIKLRIWSNSLFKSLENENVQDHPSKWFRNSILQLHPARVKLWITMSNKACHNPFLTQSPLETPILPHPHKLTNSVALKYSICLGSQPTVESKWSWDLGTVESTTTEIREKTWPWPRMDPSATLPLKPGIGELSRGIGYSSLHRQPAKGTSQLHLSPWYSTRMMTLMISIQSPRPKKKKRTRASAVPVWVWPWSVPPVTFALHYTFRATAATLTI